MNERILLVDDEPNLRLALTDTLIMAGYAVEAVADGEAAWAVLDRQPVDVIVADIVMPRMDGWELVQRVREDPRFTDVVFIFVTARGQRADERLGRELGADDYLSKPFDPDDLLALIQTRLRRREAIMASYQDQILRLEELNRIKDEFVALTSHELARPLSAIRGFADLLLMRSAEASDQRTFLELIRAESQGMAGLADDLLMLTSLERGRQLEKEPIAVDECLREVMAPFHRPPMSHRFQLLAAEGLPLVRGDLTLLQRALTNLLGNAVKYSPARSAIRVHAYAKDGGMQIDIADEGIGIPTAELAQVGKPFYRVKSEATRGIPGTGLGLALVHRIVQAHGGTVAIDSTVGVGTTVQIWLPGTP